MRKHSFTNMFAVLVALALVAPATASAGSLLSGYGGPGQGNQAILGSGLVGGSSGSGGGGAGGVAVSAAAGGQTSIAAAITVPEGTAAAASRGAHRAGGSGERGESSAGARDAGANTLGVAAVALTGNDKGPVLGLSGTDLLYLLLALVVLLFAALATRSLTRDPGVRGRAG
jgi:hypothetical protein